MTQRPGNMIVEVLVGISIAALVIVSIGNLVDSVNKTDRAAANKNQALAYARESLEVITAIARAQFQCTAGSPGCTCTALFGYTTCWQECPFTVPGCAPTYHLTNSGTWHVVSGAESIGTNPTFSRFLEFTSVSGDTNLKYVTATVGWTEGTRSRTVTQATLLSGWKQ